MSKPLIDCAIIVAHTTLNKGVVGRLPNGEEGYSEFDFNMELALQLLNSGEEDFTRNIFIRDPYGNTHDQTTRLLKEIEAFNPLCVVELHFNWLMSKVFVPDHWLWESCRAIIKPGDSQAEQLAKLLVEHVSDRLDLPNTKVQPQIKSWVKAKKNAEGNWTPDGPPLEILTRSTSPTVLLEHHVGNNPTAHTKAIAELKNETLSLAIEKSIAIYLNNIQF